MAIITEGYFKVRKGWNNTKSEYVSFKRRLSAYVKDDVEVVLHNMNKAKSISDVQEQIRIGDKVLNIVCWGYHTNNLSLPCELALMENTQVYIPNDCENEIIFKWCDVPVASYQVDKNIIWLLWDASNATNTNVLKANFSLIKKCIEHFKEKIDNDIFKKTIQLPTNLKIDGLKYFNETETANKRNRLVSVNNEIDYMLRNLAQKNKDRNLIIQEISNLENQKSNEITIVNKYVKHIEVRNNLVDVYTDNIFIKEFEINNFDRLDVEFVKKVKEKNIIISDCSWYIGQFKITIDMRTYDIKFYNLNNSRPGYWTAGNNMHPHIDNNGRACFGNLTEMIAFATSEAKLDILIDVLIQYLQSVNLTDPAGKRVTSWDFINLKTNTEALTNNEFILPKVEIMFREE